MYIDAHTHINLKEFRNDADDVIKRALKEDIWIIVVGSEAKSSKRGLGYANKYEKGIYAAVGLHPMNSGKNIIKSKDKKYNFKTVDEDFDTLYYQNLAEDKKVVAIGEIGLDYHLSKNIKKQKVVFMAQLSLARKMGLPVIIHCGETAHSDMLHLLTNFQKNYFFEKDEIWGVMHDFSGNENLAWKYISLGLLISFRGLITFDKKWDDLIYKIPLSKIIIETDSPYMTPEPFRNKRNEPLFVKYVAQKIADIKGVDIEIIAKETTKNARNFFRI